MSMNKLTFLKLILLFILFGVFNLFLCEKMIITGSEKIPAFLLPVNENANVNKFSAMITREQKKSATNFFKVFPFLFRSSVEYYFKNSCSYTNLDYLSVAFLQTIQSSWALNLIFECLDADDPWMRIGAADALKSYSTNEKITIKLMESWSKERFPLAQLTLAEALCRIHDERIAKMFKNSLDDVHVYRRNISLVALYKVTSDKKIENEILKILKFSSVREAGSLTSILWAVLRDESKQFLIEAEKNRNSLIRKSAKYYLENLDKDERNANVETGPIPVD